MAFTWKTKVGYFAFVIAISIGVLASYLGGFRHYRESPSSLKITKNNLVIRWRGIFGNTKESERIAWNNIVDCTPKSHWIIRTKDGSKYDLRTVDNEIIQRVYNYWKDRKVNVFSDSA